MRPPNDACEQPLDPGMAPGTDPDVDPAMDPTLGSELRRPLPGPDLTAAVLRRLGVAPASTPGARRRRVLRATFRGAICVVAVAMTVMVVNLQRMSTETGSAGTASAAPTIPSAIRHDLAHHGTTIDRAIRSIRNLSPARVVTPAGETPPSPFRDAGPQPSQPQTLQGMERRSPVQSVLDEPSV